MQPKTMYYVLSALVAAGMGTICVAYGPFLKLLGLSYAEFGLINCVFWGIVIGTELPTGALADGRSRSWSVAMSGFFYLVSALVYFFAQGFWSALSAEILAGVASAFMSGAKQAWLVDSLKRSGLVGDELKKVTKKTFAMDKIIAGSIMLVFGVFGSWLSQFGDRLIWLPLIFSGLGAWCLASFFMNGHGEPEEKLSEIEALKRSFALLRQSRDLVWVAFVLIVFGLVVSFNQYWSVYFNQLFGDSSSAYVWLVMYPALLLAGFTIRSRHFLSGREETGILVALLFTGLGLILATVFKSWAFVLPAVVLHELGRGMLEPLTDAFIHGRVESSFRATFGSLQSLIGRIGFALTLFVVWLSLRNAPNTNATITTVWIVCGGLILLGTIVLFVLRPKEK